MYRISKNSVLQALSRSQNLKSIISSLSGMGKRLLNQLIAFDNNCDSIYVSQTTLSTYVSGTRCHVNVLIKELVERGLLEKKYRYRRTCLYALPSIFQRAVIRDELKSILPALRALTFKVVLQLTALAHMANLTPYKGSNNMINNINKKGGVLPTLVSQYAAVARRFEQQHSPPAPQLTIEERKKLAELRKQRAALHDRPLLEKIRSEALSQETTLSEQGKAFLSGCPALQKILSRASQKQEIESSIATEKSLQEEQVWKKPL